MPLLFGKPCKHPIGTLLACHLLSFNSIQPLCCNNIIYLCCNQSMSITQSHVTQHLTQDKQLLLSEVDCVLLVNLVSSTNGEHSIQYFAVDLVQLIYAVNLAINLDFLIARCSRQDNQLLSLLHLGIDMKVDCHDNFQEQSPYLDQLRVVVDMVVNGHIDYMGQSTTSKNIPMVSHRNKLGMRLNMPIIIK